MMVFATVEVNVTEEPAPAFLAYHQYGESVLAMTLLRYLTPIIVIVGTIGNMLSFAVLMRKPLRRTSIYVYLAVLAWADTAVLYLSAFKTWIRLISGWEFLHVSEASCKILTHLFVVSLHMAAWLIVAMSVDRLIAVSMPFRAVTWCSSNRARLISLIMFIVFVVFHIHIFWKFELMNIEGKYQCAGSVKDYFIVNVFPWLRLVTYSLIPFSIVLIINIVIIVKLLRQRANIDQSNRPAVCNHISPMVLQQRRLTLMLLSVSIVWLALSTPFTIWRLVYPGIKTTDQHHRARIFLARTICFLLMWMNHSVNFALYCLTGKKFRAECLDFFHIITRNSMRRRSSSTSRSILRKTSSF